VSFDAVTVKPRATTSSVRKFNKIQKQRKGDQALNVRKQKYERGDKLETKNVRDKKLQSRLRSNEKAIASAVEGAARAEILLAQDQGYLEAEGMEETWKFSQKAIGEHVDVRTKQKMFSLELDQFGPYSMNYTRNGTHILLGGRKGHLAIMDWYVRYFVCLFGVASLFPSVYLLFSSFASLHTLFLSHFIFLF